MAGNGTAADLSTQDLTVASRFQTLRSADCFSGYGEWGTAVPPLARCSNVAIGPTDYFGRTMIENLPTQVKVGAVVVAVGGADIALFHKTNYANYVASAPNWMKNEINQYGGNPYGRLVELAKEAQKEGVIKGILLHQGESNNNQSDWPEKVKAVYDNLIADLGLDPTKTPLLVGETVNADQGGACSAHNNQVARMPDFVPNAHVISSSGLPCKSDKLHFTAPSYRTLGERYAQKMLTLVTTGPSVSLTSQDNVTSATLGDPLTLSATTTEATSTISKVEFYEGSTLIGSDNTSPFSVSWTAITSGEKQLTAKVLSNQNGTYTSASLLIQITVPQSPFNGTPHLIPGLIELEEYDLGGEGLGFHEGNAKGNEGGASFRDDEVDIEVCLDTDGGYNIGYALKDEWLAYTVDVTSSGSYTLDLRVAADGDNKTIHIEIDGEDVTGPIAIPNTGGWQNWETITVNDVALTAGLHTMKVVFDVNYINLNYVVFKGLITGGNTFSERNFRVYPNPFSEKGFKIHSNEKLIYTISDINGATLEQGIVGTNATLGNGLAPGVYLFKVNSVQGIKTFKIVKQ